MSTYSRAVKVCFLAASVAGIVATRLSAQPGGDGATSIKPGESCPPGTTAR